MASALAIMRASLARISRGEGSGGSSDSGVSGRSESSCEPSSSEEEGYETAEEGGERVEEPIEATLLMPLAAESSWSMQRWAGVRGRPTVGEPQGDHQQLASSLRRAERLEPAQHRDLLLGVGGGEFYEFASEVAR